MRGVNMKKIKRVVSYIITFILFITLIQLPVNSKADEKVASDVYIKIRYEDPNKDYDGWNFWIWEKGKEGKR